MPITTFADDADPTVRTSRRPLMLASVTSPEEADICLRSGADIIDAKDPSRGALGALPTAVVTKIAAAARAQGRPSSATVGDLPMQPDTVAAAVLAMAATGVDVVKIGFIAGSGAFRVARRLSVMARGGQRLVGVLFGDKDPDLGFAAALAEAGFEGVMLDTADKASGSLPQAVSEAGLRAFVETARDHGLTAGLAGSLGIGDIAPLSRLRPDILGFRGALCLDRSRTSALHETLVQSIRARLDATATDGSAARHSG